MSYNAIIARYHALYFTAKYAEESAVIRAELWRFLSLEGCFATNIPAYSETRKALVQ